MNGELRVLHRGRPRSSVLRASIGALALLALYAWLAGDVSIGALFTARRLDNLERFLERDAAPYPLRESGFSWTGLADWVLGVVRERGAGALLATLWISVLAIVLASAAAAILAPLGARTLMTDEPFRLDAAHRQPLRWAALTGTVRTAMIGVRAIPEYVWAFLLLAMVGPSPWPAVLALAVHNAGILGRLGADTIENLDRAPLRALRLLGASRRDIAGAALLPLALPRFLLFFFYRFETCVREATVLGMLGVVSLGYWIQDARARQLYDEMLLLVALGGLLVVAADVASQLARGWIRRGL